MNGMKRAPARKREPHHDEARQGQDVHAEENVPGELVSCPIYCTRCGQSAPVDVDEGDLPDRGGGRQGSAPSVPRLPADSPPPLGSPFGRMIPQVARRSTA
jgi:hypothetical protein